MARQILFGGIEGTARFFEENVGFEDGLVLAWVVGFSSSSAALCLALGLATRLAAGPIIVFLIMTIVTYHWEFGFNWENARHRVSLVLGHRCVPFSGARRRAMVARRQDRTRDLIIRRSGRIAC